MVQGVTGEEICTKSTCMTNGVLEGKMRFILTFKTYQASHSTKTMTAITTYSIYSKTF